MASCHITSWQIEGGESGSNDRFYFLGLQNDCWWWLQPLEIKRRLLFGKKAMTNLGSILTSRDITLPTKVHIVKAMVFPVVMCGCESWTIKKAECWRIDAFELWCWRSLLRVSWTERISNQSILKEIIPEYLLERLCPPRVHPILSFQLQYWSWNSSTLATWCEELTHLKRP